MVQGKESGYTPGCRCASHMCCVVTGRSATLVPHGSWCIQSRAGEKPACDASNLGRNIPNGVAGRNNVTVSVTQFLGFWQEIRNSGVEDERSVCANGSRNGNGTCVEDLTVQASPLGEENSMKVLFKRILKFILKAPKQQLRFVGMPGMPSVERPAFMRRIFWGTLQM